ncbi:MAG: O-antigen ligase family protein [Planctomycetaceae bacterium]|nr:O-antigen ligase family protein [Planctomycetaceae bacterium]
MKVTQSQIGFLLFLIANATIYIRPWEIIPALAGVQMYLFLILAAAICSFQQIQKHLTTSNLMGQPITLCVLGVLVAIGVSHMTNGYLGGAISGSITMFKTVVYYLVLVATINTASRLRYFIISLVLCGTICIGLSVADYHHVLNIQALTHIVEGHGELSLVRLCGIGMFHDPNDLSLLIITTGVLCLSQLTDRSWGSSRMVWLLPFPLLMLAMIDTHSRGGLIAAGAAMMAFFLVRYGRSFAISAAAMGVVAAPLVLGRMGNIDVSSGTGQQRIRLWSEGFTAIQSPRILFGIGEGMYEGLANYVAHNSYVHAFVELGVFGGTMFVGCFFFAAYGI